MRRLALCPIVALCALAVSTSVARAGELIGRAVEALRDDPVYVDPQAELALTTREAERVRARIAEPGGGPIYVAVLHGSARAEAGGDTSAVLDTLARELGRRGTYAVAVGTELRAAGTDFPVRQLADEAFRAHGADGLAPTLLDFIDRVEHAQAAGAGAGAAAEGGGDGGSGAGGILALVAAGAAGAIGIHALRARRRRREQLEPVRRAAQEDLLALADDIRDLDLDVEMPGASVEAKEDYAAAVRCYERADGELDRVRRPEDLEAVTAAIEEGRFAIACAKARLEGRPPPERRPPCFFDPRHGPSDRDVEWAPPGGAPRLVPTCEADAQRVERGLDPSAREVVVGGQAMPYWNAPAQFGPWAGGYFGGLTGGLLPGLLIGSMLGGGLGLAAPDYARADPGDGLDSGDFGGGDFGGGDFGDFGGDFGGGDLGGGDFGGGDFGGGE